ncbi:hypothetical protein HAX54_016695, partial [Datura stramonium]|nr:hypothetical protein [Datura stramonium]
MFSTTVVGKNEILFQVTRPFLHFLRHTSSPVPLSLCTSPTRSPLSPPHLCPPASLFRCASLRSNNLVHLEELIDMYVAFFLSKNLLEFMDSRVVVYGFKDE